MHATGVRHAGAVAHAGRQRVEYVARSRQRRGPGSWTRGQVREIRKVGDPLLRSPCDDVRSFDSALIRLVDDLLATMYDAQGVGLAANQIGVGRRVFVFDCPDDDGVWHRGVVVNPIVTGDAAAAVDDVEGCLSLPGFHAQLARPAAVAVAGADPYGHPVEVSASGFLARCLRHETDHLDGRLFTDLLVGDARKAALRAIRELASGGPA
jgi:peptide deformylase